MCVYVHMRACIRVCGRLRTHVRHCVRVNVCLPLRLSVHPSVCLWVGQQLVGQSHHVRRTVIVNHSYHHPSGQSQSSSGKYRNKPHAEFMSPEGPKTLTGNSDMPARSAVVRGLSSGRTSPVRPTRSPRHSPRSSPRRTVVERGDRPREATRRSTAAANASTISLGTVREGEGNPTLQGSRRSSLGSTAGVTATGTGHRAFQSLDIKPGQRLRIKPRPRRMRA